MNNEQCFYCDALVSFSSSRGDHFPIPAAAGGTDTVPCCLTCHDMKDRFPLDRWPAEMIGAVMADFSKLSRETRIFLAKSIGLYTTYRYRRLPDCADLV